MKMIKKDNNKNEVFSLFKNYLLELSTDLINNSDKWNLFRFDYKTNSLIELVNSINIGYNDQFIFNLEKKTIILENNKTNNKFRQ